MRLTEQAETYPDYAAWLRANPGTGFADYYVNNLTQQLDAGRLLPRIGRELSSGKDVEAVAAGYLNTFVRLGLKPSHVCLDFGCGGLLPSRHVIPFLEPGNFWGLDVTDRFYQVGLETLDPAMIQAKKPHLHIISDEILSRFSAHPADFIYSIAVLSHVHPDEAPHYFSRMIGCMGADSTLYLNSMCAEETESFSKLSWVHSLNDLQGIIESLGAQVDFWEPHKPQVLDATGKKAWKQRMVITRVSGGEGDYP